MRLPIVAVLLALILPGLASPEARAADIATPADIPLEDFVDLESFGTIRVSPDGRHFAATVPFEDRSILVILRREDMKRTATVAMDKQAHVSSFTWVNPRELVFTVATRHGPLDHPVHTPFLYLTDVEGNTRALRRGERMHLLDELRDNDEEIMVSVDGGYQVARLNLATGKVRREKLDWPVYNRTAYYLDNASDVRAVFGFIANEMYSRLYLRSSAGEWRMVHDGNITRGGVGVAGFSRDNRYVYLIEERNDGPDRLVAVDLDDFERKQVLRDPRVDIDDTLYSPVHGGLIAAVHLDGKPRIEYVDPEDRHSVELQKLSRAFPGSYVFPTSYTRDGNLGLYVVSSDRNSGEYYLVDHARGKAQFIAAKSEKLDPELMSPMQPVRFKARDGLELEAFLTVPISWQGKSPGPLVVMPHGGPIGVFDAWGFDPEIQMLASRGYAVLQVNFRGSGNYGRPFREAGHREWGRKMQDDLTDATRWAIAQGITAPGRICLYGASYGAYAGMMGLAREPDLYACGIGNVGVYDLDQLYREETVGTRYSRTYMDMILGGSGLEEISATNNARSIRAPVLLGAGGDDRVAPPGHTRAMIRALKSARVPVESVIYANEGHGYYDKDNRLDWARRVLALLDRTIGQGRPQG